MGIIGLLMLMDVRYVALQASVLVPHSFTACCGPWEKSVERNEMESTVCSLITNSEAAAAADT